MTRKHTGSKLPPVVIGSTLLPPPPELKAARLPITTLDLATTTLYRSHSRHRTTAGYWKSNADTRFNAPNQEFGVMYLGFSVECAFIESTGSDLLLADFRVVDRKQLDGRCICRFRATHASQPVRVVDLTGSGLAHLNLDGRISTIKEREITRQ